MKKCLLFSSGIFVVLDCEDLPAESPVPLITQRKIFQFQKSSLRNRAGPSTGRMDDPGSSGIDTPPDAQTRTAHDPLASARSCSRRGGLSLSMLLSHALPDACSLSHFRPTRWQPGTISSSLPTWLGSIDRNARRSPRPGPGRHWRPELTRVPQLPRSLLRQLLIPHHCLLTTCWLPRCANGGKNKRTPPSLE